MKWTILSHKLVHFNPRHKIVRFLHYKKKDTSKSDHAIFLYERSASHAMETLDEVLRPLLSKECVKPDKSLKDDGTITIKTPDNVNPAIWDAYLEYCKDVAEKEYKNELLNAITLRTSDRIDLPNSTKFDLLDVMPVQPHWDIMGLLTEKANETGLNGIKDFAEPFYMVRNCYKKNKVQASRSQEILGYPVMMQVGYADLAKLVPEFFYTEEKDYFDICFNPHGSELEQYKVYGALYDEIEKNTIGKSSGSGDVYTYTLIYPITTLLGRRHFWHVQLVPDESVASIQELKEAWDNIHVKLDWSLLKNLISSELEQLDWSYAQSMILKEASSGKSANDLFLEQAMMYVPMKSFTLDGKSRKYQPTKGVLLGVEWNECAPLTDPTKSCFSSCDDNLRCDTEDCHRALSWNDETIGFVPDRSVWRNNAMSPKIEIRYRHVIEQQLAVTNQLVGYKNELKRKEEAARKQKESQFLDWMYRNTIAVQDFVSKLDSMSLESIPCNCNISDMGTLKDVANCFYPEVTSEEQKQKLKGLFDYGPLTVLSRLIEFHPLKGLTHEREKYKSEVIAVLSSFKEEPYRLAVSRLSDQDTKDALTKIVNEIANNKERYDDICSQLLSENRDAIRTHTGNVKKHFTAMGITIANASEFGAATEQKKIRLPVPIGTIFSTELINAIKEIADSIQITVTLHGCCDPEDKNIPKLMDYGVEFSWSCVDTISYSEVPNFLNALDYMGIKKTVILRGLVPNNPCGYVLTKTCTSHNKICFEWKYWRITE